MAIRFVVAILFAATSLTVVVADEPGTEPSAKQQEAWTPPLVCFGSHAYGDGGTLAIGIRDGDGCDTLVVCTQDAWEDSLIPWNTLLIGSWTARGGAARLPKNRAEVDRVLAMLRTVALQTFSEAEVAAALNNESWPERDGFDDEGTALSALKRLRGNKRLPVYDPNGDDQPPAWWLKHDQQRQEGLEAAREREKAFRSKFFEWFDADTHACFEVKYGWIMSVDYSEEPFCVEDEEIETLARGLVQAHEDQTKLARNALRALSVNADDWESLECREAVCVESLRLIDASALAKAVTRLKEDNRVLPGIGRVLFGMSYDRRFSDREWAAVMPSVTEAVIHRYQDDYWKLEPIAAALRSRNLPEARALLERMANGEYSKKACEAAEEE